MSNELFSVSQEEWDIAEKYFSSHKSQNKMRRKDPVVMSSNLNHSFLKVIKDDGSQEIFAMDRVYLGQGSSGKVKLIKNRKGEKFALKIEAGQIDPEDPECEILKEFGGFYGQLERQYTPKNKRFLRQTIKHKKYTISRYLEGHTLYKELYDTTDNKNVIKKQYDLRQRLLIAIGCCEALMPLHYRSNPIIHVDIKPDNFMMNRVNGEMVLTIFDFNVSMILRDGKTFELIPLIFGSKEYLAPEILEPVRSNQRLYSLASDIYALGVMFKKDLDLPESIYSNMIHSSPEMRLNLEELLNELKFYLKNLSPSEILENQESILVKQLSAITLQNSNHSLEDQDAPIAQTVFDSAVEAIDLSTIEAEIIRKSRIFSIEQKLVVPEVALAVYDMLANACMKPLPPQTHNKKKISDQLVMFEYSRNLKHIISFEKIRKETQKDIVLLLNTEIIACDSMKIDLLKIINEYIEKNKKLIENPIPYGSKIPEKIMNEVQANISTIQTLSPILDDEKFIETTRMKILKPY